MDRKQALQGLADKARNGELVFPTGVDVSLKLMRQLEDPDCHIDQAVQLVKGAPLLAARIVAVANSAAYSRSGQSVTDLRTAISRIGLRTTRTLTMAITTQQMAGQAQSPEIARLTRQLWEHTAHVAALAQTIARRITRQDPETAFFAGIVHEIAGFYLISQAGENPGLLSGDPADWTEESEPGIAKAILTRIGTPAAVTEALENLWEGLLSLPPASLGDTLLLANELAPVGSPLYEGLAPRSPEMAPVIDALVDDAMLSSILQESAGEVASLVNALRF
jgi:HD-like signal output (HDOD) protein